MAKNFSHLREKMSPERQRRAPRRSVASREGSGPPENLLEPVTPAKLSPTWWTVSFAAAGFSRNHAMLLLEERT